MRHQRVHAEAIYPGAIFVTDIYDDMADDEEALNDGQAQHHVHNDIQLINTTDYLS